MTKILMKGNEAIAQAAIDAGCEAFFGYPITPQNELIEYMAKHMPANNRVFVQAESEVAAINMVYGAAGTGALVMTSSSSVGIALKQEGISYIAGSELGCVIVSISRSGPGLGGILPAQSDYRQSTKGGGNGDYRVIVLAPNGVQEAADMMKLAFELAQKYRNPVMVLADGVIGQMMEPVTIKKEPVKKADQSWAANGEHKARGKRNVVNSLYLNPVELEQHNLKLKAKYFEIIKNETRVELIKMEDAEVAIVAYGTSARIALSAIEMLRAQGVKAGLVRLITLWPFPEKELKEATKNCDFVLVAELSMGQLIHDVKYVLNNVVKVGFVGRAGGMIFEPSEIVEACIKQKDGEIDEYYL